MIMGNEFVESEARNINHSVPVKIEHHTAAR